MFISINTVLNTHVNTMYVSGQMTFADGVFRIVFSPVSLVFWSGDDIYKVSQPHTLADNWPKQSSLFLTSSDWFILSSISGICIADEFMLFPLSPLPLSLCDIYMNTITLFAWRILYLFFLQKSKVSNHIK